MWTLVVFSLPLGCAEPRRDAAVPETAVSLRSLSYAPDVLEGEVVNDSTSPCREAVLEVRFRVDAGAPVLTQEFRVVPGGDGRALPPGWSKHFKLKMAVSGWSERSSVEGRIKSAGGVEALAARDRGARRVAGAQRDVPQGLELAAEGRVGPGAARPVDRFRGQAAHARELAQRRIRRLESVEKRAGNSSCDWRRMPITGRRIAPAGHVFKAQKAYTNYKWSESKC